MIVDLETTGLKSDQSRILEIGAVKMRGTEVLDRFSELVNPECRVPRQITKITGLTTADIIGKPKVNEVLPAFIEFLGEDVFVAHNCRFDWGFIVAELKRTDLLDELNNRTLCTVRLARRLLPGLPSRSLGSLIQFYGLEVDSRHRALSDAIATQEVLVHLLKKLETQYEITDLDQLLRFQNSKYSKSKANQRQLTQIRENLEAAPQTPGIYRMIRKDGRLLYIGKARVLSERVRSYFSGVEGHAPHIRKMVRQVHHVKWTQTETELEALLMESRLIKEHAPPFNKAGRSYRQRAFLRIGRISQSNWITVIEHIRADGAKHYGPMANRQEAILLAHALVSLYGVHPESPRSPERVGLGLEAAQIGGALTEDGSAHAIAFLEGLDSDALTQMENHMNEASQSMLYELAAKRRDWLAVMKKICDRPHFLRTALLERTGVVINALNGKTEVHFMAYGAPVAHIVRPCDRELFQAACARFHDRVLEPPERLSMQKVDAISLLNTWIFKQRDHIKVLPLGADTDPQVFDKSLESLLHSEIDTWGPIQGSKDKKKEN